MKEDKEVVSIGLIENKIYLIRGQRVMLDRDLADIYQVPTGHFNTGRKEKSW